MYKMKWMPTLQWQSWTRCIHVCKMNDAQKVFKIKFLNNTQVLVNNMKQDCVKLGETQASEELGTLKHMLALSSGWMLNNHIYA